MKVYLNSITGIEDAMISLLMSKRSWTPEKQAEIQKIVADATDRTGKPLANASDEVKEAFNKKLNTLINIGSQHITLGRYIDFSFTVAGLHRAGQDDWDSHAMRYCNRIIRSSTRLAKFGNEMSDFYEGKIMTTDEACEHLGIKLPEQMEFMGRTYVKTVNGYVREEYKDDKDVLRGLYMLSIPSNFTFKVSLTEWAHIYKMRNENTDANPEVKQLCEMIADELERWYPQFNRELWEKIPN